MFHTLKEQGQLITPFPRSSPWKTTKNWSKMDHTDCSMHRVLHMGGAMHTGKPFCRVWWVRADKWHKQFARWRPWESSRSCPFDTCLSEISQGWVRDHEISNWNQELSKRWHLYMDPSSQRSKRLEFCNFQGSVVGFSLKTLLGDLALYEVKRAFKLGGWHWVRPSGCNPLFYYFYQ